MSGYAADRIKLLFIHPRYRNDIRLHSAGFTMATILHREHTWEKKYQVGWSSPSSPSASILSMCRWNTIFSISEVIRAASVRSLRAVLNLIQNLSDSAMRRSMRVYCCARVRSPLVKLVVCNERSATARSSILMIICVSYFESWRGNEEEHTVKTNTCICSSLFRVLHCQMVFWRNIKWYDHSTSESDNL